MTATYVPTSCPAADPAEELHRRALQLLRSGTVRTYQQAVDRVRRDDPKLAHQARRAGGISTHIGNPITIRSAAPVANPMGSAFRTRVLSAHVLTVRAETADETTRTVEAVIATEAEVTAFDMATMRPVREILLMSGYVAPAGNQVPLLESHSRWSTDDVHGSARFVQVAGEKVVGTLHFAGDEESLRRWTKVRDGHLTDLSAGVQPLETEVVPAGMTKTISGRVIEAGDQPIHVRTRWLLRECSLVVIGADAAAKMREDESAFNERRNVQAASALACDAPARELSPFELRVIGHVQDGSCRSISQGIALAGMDDRYGYMEFHGVHPHPTT